MIKAVKNGHMTKIGAIPKTKIVLESVGGVDQPISMQTNLNKPIPFKNHPTAWLEFVFTESAPRPIQSISRDVRGMCV